MLPRLTGSSTKKPTSALSGSEKSAALTLSDEEEERGGERDDGESTDDEEDSADEDPSWIASIAAGNKVPRDYQRRGVAEILKGFGVCLGKARARWPSAPTTHATPFTVLVLAPSLALISQLAREWRDDACFEGVTGNEISFLTVCSDKQVHVAKKRGGKRKRNEAALQEEDVDDDIVLDDNLREALGKVGEVSSDRERIYNFLAAPASSATPRVRIVFCTYQSSSLVGNRVGEGALAPREGVGWNPDPAMSSFKFDLAIFDEAHRTAKVSQQGRGRRKKDSADMFQHALYDNGADGEGSGVPISMRLFMTATPRHAPHKRLSERKSKKGKEGEADDNVQKVAVSMDDLSVYGRRVPGLPGFREAIEMGHICQYRILAVTVRRSVLRRVLGRRGFRMEALQSGEVVFRARREETDVSVSVKVKEAMAMLALRKAIASMTGTDGKAIEGKKIFTYHSRVAGDAVLSAELMSEIMRVWDLASRGGGGKGGASPPPEPSQAVSVSAAAASAAPPHSAPRSLAFKTDYIGSAVGKPMTSSVRERKLDAFKHADRAVLSSVRALSEGIDIPQIQMAAYMAREC